MRVILPESGRRRKRRFGGTSASVALHAVLIGGAVAASGLRAEPPPQRESPPSLVYVKPPESRDAGLRPREARPATPVRPPPSLAPAIRLLPAIEPLVIADPRVVPEVLPNIDARLDAVSTGAPPGVAASASPASGGREGGTPSGAPFTALTVEREVHLLGAVTLRYPALLQGAGVEGEVVLQYVVDTLGRVEKESIRAVRRDHVLFEQSARDAVLRLRFAPAEAGGRKVRQLVEQRFAFEIR